MSREEIYAQLNEVFQDVFDDEDIVVCDSTTADDIEDWDNGIKNTSYRIFS